MKLNLLPSCINWGTTFAPAFITPIIIGFKGQQACKHGSKRRVDAGSLKQLCCLGYMPLSSKEKIEDEFINACGLKAFKVA